MYRAATEEDQLRFGDVVEADWVFDLCLRDDARALIRQTVRGGEVLIAQDRSAVTRRRDYPKDIVLAHSGFDDLALGHASVENTTTARRAVVVSDDCDIQDAIKTGRGRLRIAGLVALPPAGTEEREHWLASEAFDRFPLRPQDELEPSFEGGVIEFQRTVAVMAKDLLDLKPVLTIEDEQDRQNLRIRWTAHAARHGPAVTAQSALDLIKLLIIDGDEERARELRDAHNPILDADDMEMIRRLKGVAALTWTLEGGNVDAIAAALERGDAPDTSLDTTADLLERLGAACAEAVAAVRASGARRGPRSED